MRKLIASLFFVLASAAQAATVVDEKSFSPVALPDDFLEECNKPDCLGGWFSEPRSIKGINLNFEVPLGMRLARARIDYTILFVGVGDFDFIRFWTRVESVGPLGTYHGEDAQVRLTAASPTKKVSNSFRYPVSKSTIPPFSPAPYFLLDASGNSDAWGRNPSRETMRIGLSYRLSYTTVPIAPVPLPPSGFAMLLALGGLGLVFRRRGKTLVAN